MAQEILVVLKEPLTRDMIEAGQAFVEALDRHKYRFTAAFWLYESERNRWRMMLAVPTYRTEGPLKVYGRVLDIVRKESIDESVADNLGAIDSKHKLAVYLRKQLGKRTGVRFAGPTDDEYVDDAYVYRATA